MSKEKFYSLVDQVSRGVIHSVEEIDRELAELGGAEAQSVRKMLPAIVLSIAVLRLCQDNPPDEVLGILKAVSIKVETGDYYPGGMSFGQTAPPDGDDGPDGSGGGPPPGGGAGKGPTIN
jgi:hypothetical protein